MSEPGQSTDECAQAFEEPTIQRPEAPLVIIRRTPEEEEEEYRKFQEQITQEQLEEAQRKVETIMAQSNYTLTSQLIDEAQAEHAQTVSWGKAVTSNDLNSGSLVRLFKSDFFDSWIGISYLYRYPSSGVHDYLCNALYTLPDDDMEFYLVELCTMLVHAEFGSSALERYIMDKCKTSVHFALQINWLMQASMADSEEKRRRAEMLQEKCEMATVNGTWDQPQPSVLLVQNHSNESASELLRMQLDGTLNLYSTPPRGLDLSSSGDISLPKSSSAPNLLQVHDQIESEALEKQDRCDYFYKILHFVEDLGRISERLRTVPVNLRQKQLVEELTKWNETFPVGIYLPLWEASTSHYCICRVVPEEGRVLKSRERAPFILVVEAIVSPEPAASKTVHKFAREADGMTRRLREALAAQALSETTELPPDYEVPHQPEDAAPEPELPPLPDPSTYANSPFGEPWDVRAERIRRQSPYGRLPSWHIRSVIVKAGDDCRQEYLAMQLITQFKKIFKDADLPLYLRPYRILVNSTDSGLIETVTDAISIHQLKRFYTPEGSSQTISLTEHFRRFYGADTPEYEQAVKNFVESLAAYSLVCFLLQIKDRHNGNLMLDSAGHMIHIDFGFMLSNSPGQINAEKVPFKFTQEYLELMGGFSSPNFSYFKSLLLKGYLEVRKQSEKIILLVEIMAVGSKLPCFYTGQSAIDNLRDRFNLRMPEKQVVEFVENMLSTSFDSWRTRYYDRFQYMTNNILY